MKRVQTFLGGLFLMVGVVFCAAAAAMLLAREPLWFFVVVFAAVGIVTGIMGLVMIWKPLHRDRVIARLLESGTRVNGRVEYIGQDGRVTMNGRHPFVIRCSWMDPVTGKSWLFDSESFWFDPAPYLKDRQTLPVYYDPANPRKHMVDTSGILPEGS